MRWTLQQRLQGRRHRNRFADQRFHHRLELGRVRGSDHCPITLGAARAQILQHLHRRGRMRAEQFAVAGMGAGNGRADGHVIHCEGAERCAQFGVVAVVQPAQTLEVAGSADVHGVGHGRNAGRRPVPIATEVSRQHRVGIGRQHDLPDRHAQRARQHRRHRVAEISGRHHQVQAPLMLRVVGQRRMRVIAHLRQQPAQADAVG
ncbi:hypothetical protein D3C81_1056250 [compost metagenome]